MTEGKEFQNHGFDVDVVVNLCRIRIQQEGHIALVCERDGELKGVLSGYLTPFLLSRKLIAVEDIWYLSPEARKGRDGIRLVQHFEKWAESYRAHAVSMSVTIGTDNAKAIRILERLGFRNIGSCLVKEVCYGG